MHPSTGYMVSRVLGAAPLVADAIIDQLSSGGGQGSCCHCGLAGWLLPGELLLQACDTPAMPRLAAWLPRPPTHPPRPPPVIAVSDKATDVHLARAPRSDAEAAAMSAAVWRTMWPVQRLRQREFFEFGMEVGGLPCLQPVHFGSNA